MHTISKNWISAAFLLASFSTDDCNAMHTEDRLEESPPQQRYLSLMPSQEFSPAVDLDSTARHDGRVFFDSNRNMLYIGTKLDDLAPQESIVLPSRKDEMGVVYKLKSHALPQTVNIIPEITDKFFTSLIVQKIIQEVRMGRDDALNNLIKYTYEGLISEDELKKINFQPSLWQLIAEKSLINPYYANFLISAGQIENFPDIVTFIQNRADNQDSVAQCSLGYIYFKKFMTTTSTNEDEKHNEYIQEAVRWNNMASLNGIHSGLCRSALLNEEKDPREAFKYYMRAATLGVSAGMFGVAKCLDLGIGVDRDREKAVSSFIEYIKEQIVPEENLKIALTRIEENLLYIDDKTKIKKILNEISKIKEMIIAQKHLFSESSYFEVFTLLNSIESK